MSLARGKQKIPVPALGVIAEFHGDRFEQRGLARAVFADEEGDGRMKFKAVQLADRRNRKRIRPKIRDALAFQSHGVEKGAADHWSGRLTGRFRNLFFTWSSATFLHAVLPFASGCFFAYAAPP